MRAPSQHLLEPSGYNIGSTLKPRYMPYGYTDPHPDPVRIQQVDALMGAPMKYPSVVGSQNQGIHFMDPLGVLNNPDPREDPKSGSLNGGSYKVPLVV